MRGGRFSFLSVKTNRDIRPLIDASHRRNIDEFDDN